VVRHDACLGYDLLAYESGDEAVEAMHDSGVGAGGDHEDFSE
jgi:hypothetical protein